VATEAIKTAIHDPDSDVRVVVCEAWGRRGGDESRHLLAEMLGNDTNVDVRIAATKALGRFKNDPEALRALRLAMDDNSPAMQYRAVESARTISGKDFGNNLIAWREYMDGGNPPEQPSPSLAERLKQWY
jgi:HEAT repeat protein